MEQHYSLSVSKTTFLAMLKQYVKDFNGTSFFNVCLRYEKNNFLLLPSLIMTRSALFYYYGSLEESETGIKVKGKYMISLRGKMMGSVGVIFLSATILVVVNMIYQYLTKDIVPPKNHFQFIVVSLCYCFLLLSYWVASKKSCKKIIDGLLNSFEKDSRVIK